MAAATDQRNSDEYVTRGYLDRRLDDFRASINRDLRHALDEALGRQSADFNRKFGVVDKRFDALETKMDERMDRLEAKLVEIAERLP